MDFTSASLLLYAGFGCLAGLLSGLFGIGGGVVIVPFLAWQFTEQQVPDRFVMVVAVATSLATVAITSVSAVYAHHRLGAVHWGTVGRLAPGILLGAVIGSMLAEHLPTLWFKLIFAVFLLWVALRMLGTPAPKEQHPWHPALTLMGAAGLVIGLISAVLGIGGGTLSVPFLTRIRFPLRNAVAISSACGFPIAVASTLSYILLGSRQVGLPPEMLGYIHLPGFVGIICGSVVSAPLGARLAHGLPTAQLKKLFALLLLFIGGKLLWQTGPLWKELPVHRLLT